MISDDVIFLLGAGASHDAGLKTSDEMTDELELLLTGELNSYQKLYNAVKAGILYGYALKGAPRQKVNIEEFVNVLTELARCKDHPIFPFIASWNMELMETAGKEFKKIADFRREIVKRLVEQWVRLEDHGKAYYYRKIQYFANDLGSNLRVFSLNYDLCVESGCTSDAVFTGFGRESNQCGRVWHDSLMLQDDVVTSPVRLYKLHGSVDWRQENGLLVSHDSPRPCGNADDYQLIFGTANKMRYTEPYLFLLSEFRRCAYNAKVIICIGYSFQDAHINSILQHAFESRAKTKLVHVTWAPQMKRDEFVQQEQKRVSECVRISSESVVVYAEGAKEFLEKELQIDAVSRLIVDENRLF